MTSGEPPTIEVRLSVVSIAVTTNTIIVNVDGPGMDIAQLAENLPPDGGLPGVALLVARDVIESAVIAGGFDAKAKASLRAASDHLNHARGRRRALAQTTWLSDELARIASVGELPDAKRLDLIRDSLRDLVRDVPAEGSVPPHVQYAGF